MGFSLFSLAFGLWGLRLEEDKGVLRHWVTGVGLDCIHQWAGWFDY